MHPVDVLLIVERDNPPRTAGLGEEAVEAVERAHIKHATARETIRAEHPEAVAVIPGDTRRVDPRRERERVKPQRNRIADTLSLRRRRSDRLHVGDSPLGTGRLRDRLDRDRIDCQRINSSSRSHHVHNSITDRRQQRSESPDARRRESVT